MLTPQAYYHALHQSLHKSPGGVCIEDIFAIPDYESYFSGYTDPKFGIYCKGENTQLQFIFEYVECCAEFPLGCMTTYRAYSKDQVIEIYENETPLFPGINLKARKCQVGTFPKENQDKSIPRGMYILKELPPATTKLLACPLIQNSKELLDDVIVDIKKTFGRFQSDVVDAWEKWADLFAPKNNDVKDFIKT